MSCQKDPAMALCPLVGWLGAPSSPDKTNQQLANAAGPTSTKIQESLVARLCASLLTSIRLSKVQGSGLGVPKVGKGGVVDLSRRLLNQLSSAEGRTLRIWGA